MPPELAGVFAVILTLVGPPPEDTPNELQLKEGNRIVAIGDSITEGGGYLKYIDAVLAKQYPQLKMPKIINNGISGQKAEDLVTRFQKDVVDLKPAFVTISVGINDVWQRLGEPNSQEVLKAYKANVARMVDMAQSAGIKVVLLTPTVIEENPESEGNKRLALYVQAEKQIAAEKKCRIVDLHKMFVVALATKSASTDKTGDLRFTVDGVHMAPHGDAIMAVGVLRTFGVPDSKLK